MTCNIITNESGHIRTTQFSSTTHYDIGEINFYAPSSMASHAQMFLILKNKKGLYEIIELVRSGTQGTNALYRIPVNQALRVNDEEVEVRLLILNTAADTYILSSPVNMFIHTNNYNIARQIYIAQQIGSSTQAMYSKIVAMTEENKKIYENMMKGVPR